MQLVFLDTKTIGNIPNLRLPEKFGRVTYYETTTPEQVRERIRDADIVITNKVVLDRDTIAQAPKLKLICIAATGTNNVDRQAAEARGIPVRNAVDYSTASVAQGTFALLFQLMIDIPYFDRYVKDGSYSRSDIFTHFGRGFIELAGKRFGIVGMGNIGRQVAGIAEAFGAEVVYYSTSGRNTDQPYRRLELEEFLSTCDVVSIHAPLNEKTAGLIDYGRLTRMKPSAYLLNVGRGGIVVEADLARALDEGRITGAGIDVFEHEPIRPDHPLLHLKHPGRLVLTPHVTWASIESRTRLMEKVGRNIEDFLNEPGAAGGRPQTESHAQPK
ncbi:D-2-hydroxyacid dehydrogenase [Larkinella soli]|uniref:D-2-hydroxyacid dehydrogenase n=1 Tax=Larkinella soli TaxID=1770527 RepID=UPI000FFB2CEF|nr:D-2-hydroxyacid dehydrogenase [Larkinella soli]